VATLRFRNRVACSPAGRSESTTAPKRRLRAGTQSVLILPTICACCAALSLYAACPCSAVQRDTRLHMTRARCWSKYGNRRSDGKLSYGRAASWPIVRHHFVGIEGAHCGLVGEGVRAYGVGTYPGLYHRHRGPGMRFHHRRPFDDYQAVADPRPHSVEAPIGAGRRNTAGGGDRRKTIS
jgi:hypothetical protein